MNHLFIVFTLISFFGFAEAKIKPAPHLKSDPKTLVIAFQPDENLETLKPKAEKLTHFLEPRLGIPVKTFLTTQFSSILEALRSGQIHVSYFGAWAAVKAQEMSNAELFLAEERNGKTSYDSAWFILASNNKIQKLADLKGRKIAFTNPVSTSGYLMPYSKLIEENLLKPGENPKKFASEVIFAGGYEQALKALITGQVDAAASSDYSPEKYLSAEDRAQVKVLATHGPCPTHGLSMRKDLSASLQEKIKKAFLELNRPENQPLLKELYGAKKLVDVQHDQHIQSILAAIKNTRKDFDIKDKNAK